MSRYFAINVLVGNYNALLKYCEEQAESSRDPIAKYCFKILNSSRLKAALFVLHDILEELADMSKTFQKSDLTPMEALVIAESKISKLRAQYLTAKIHWSCEVEAIISKYDLTDADMAPILKFIERLCV